MNSHKKFGPGLKAVYHYSCVHSTLDIVDTPPKTSCSPSCEANLSGSGSLNLICIQYREALSGRGCTQLFVNTHKNVCIIARYFMASLETVKETSEG